MKTNRGVVPKLPKGLLVNTNGGVVPKTFNRGVVPKLPTGLLVKTKGGVVPKHSTGVLCQNIQQWCCA